MKKRSVLFHVSLLVVAAWLTSCGNPFFSKPPHKDSTKGLVSIRVSDENAGQRTLLPSEPGFSRYDLTFAREGKAPVALSSTDSPVTVELEGGAWKLTAKAYVAIQGQDRLAAQGEKTITVIAGQSTAESIAVAANNAGEEGILSYDIRLSLDRESLSKALLVLESLGGEYETEIDLLDGGGGGLLALKPGFYLLKVQLENGYQTAGKAEVVHIYTNMETKANYAFKSSDLTKIIPIGGTAQITTHGAPQKTLGLFIYRDEGYEDLIAHTAVNLSDHTWETVIPDIYEKVYFKFGVEDETGFSFYKAAGDADMPEIGKIDIALDVTIPEPRISSFLIGATEAGPSGDITGLIDETQSKITLASQEWIENIDSLKAAFGSTGTVTVGEVEQESGVTEQDFRNDLVYRVTTEDNAENEYTVVFESPQTTGLPVMKIDTQGVGIVSKDDWFSDLNPGMEVSYTVYDDITGEIVADGSTDIKGRGNTTWDMPKKPYTLKLDSKASLLGMPAHKRWNLLANYSDKTLLRTEVAFKMGEILKNGLAWTPRSRHVQLYLNNVYQGAYQLVEAIKIDENRVNIKEITKKNPQRGYILEVDARKGEEFNFTTSAGVVFNCSDPDEDLDEVITGDTITLFEKIQADVQHVEDVLYSDAFSDPEDGYRKYLDVDSFIDWYLVNEITKNHDAVFATSVYMYYDPVKEKYCMGPVWDFDISMGNIDYDDNNNPEGFWIKKANWIKQLFEDPEFVLSVKSRWNTKKNEFLALSQYIDDRVSYLNDAQIQNFKKWDILGIYVWPNAVVSGTYQREIAYLKTWLADRLQWLDIAINSLE